MQQHGSKYCAHRPLPPPLTPLTLGLGSKGQNSTFSEHGHVAYKIKWNQECSKMVANILPTDPPLPWGCGQNSTLSKHSHVAYQIKGNRAAVV